jgi:hypothetical protein
MKYAILNQDKTDVLYITDNVMYKNYIEYDISNPAISNLINEDTNVVEFLDRVIQEADNRDILQKELDDYVRTTYKKKYFLIQTGVVVQIKDFNTRELSDFCLEYEEFDVENVDERITNFLLKDKRQQKQLELKTNYIKTKDNVTFCLNGTEARQEWNLDTIIELVAQKKEGLSILEDDNNLLNEAVEFVLSDGQIKFVLMVANIPVLLTKQQLATYYFLLTQKRALYYKTRIEKEKAIEDAESLSEVNAIDCTFNAQNLFIVG